MPNLIPTARRGKSGARQNAPKGSPIIPENPVAIITAPPPNNPATVPAVPVDSAKLQRMTEEALAKAINTRLPRVASAILKARQHANMAVITAIEIGHHLNEAKRRAEKGQWEAWREKHCPDLSKPTACRYMKLATQVSHVTPSLTLRQAYIECGILPDEPAAPKRTPNLDCAPKPGAADILAQVKSFKHYVRSFQHMSLETMEAPIVDQLVEEMSALRALCDDVIKRAAAERPPKPVENADEPSKSETMKKGAQ